MLTDEADFITGLYRGVLGREPDAAGLRHHAETLERTRRRRDTIAAFVESDEFRARIRAELHGRKLDEAAPQAFANAAYRMLLGRDPNAAEVREITSLGRERRGKVLAELVASVEFHEIHVVRARDLLASFPRSALEVSIAERFEDVVARHADRPAIGAGGETLDYEALNALVNRIAHALLERDAKAPQNVALLVEHGVFYPAAALAVAKAGGTWLQLHPRHPLERSRFLIDDAEVGILVTERGLAAQARWLASRSVRPLDVVIVEETRDLPSRNPGVSSAPEAPALIKYTSGSTGRPKGVCLPARMVLHAAMVYGRQRGLRVDDRISALSVGIGATEFTGALLNGAALFPFDVQREGTERFVDWLTRERITWLQIVPTVLRRLGQQLGPDRRLEHVRLVRSGGEAATQTEWRIFLEHFSATARLHVALGSSEALTYRTGLFDRSDPPTGAVLPLADAVEDKEVLLLDEHRREVAPGEVGEVTVRSEFLFSGYWKRPELTAAVLVPDPDSPRRRCFRSGDFARLLPDGRLVFSGRRDTQVKISGNRVETAEVEDALRRIPGIRDAAVVPRRRGPNVVHLVAFCAIDGAAPPRSEVRRHLAEWLPDPMLPAAFVFADELPVLAGGKVDRAALAARIPRNAAEPVPPRNPVELTLVEIWQRALAVDGIGIHDDLFLDLGGDSLAAVQIMSEIGEVFRRELPLAVLQDAPTVAGLAARLGDDGWQPPLDGRLCVNPLGTRPAIFALCGIYGHALRLLLIGRALGADQPFWGFQPPGMDWASAGSDTLEKMAEHYLGEIRSLQPAGPYRLLGASFGGVMAFEVATQLERAGEQVELLAMIDTMPPASLGAVASGERFDFAAGADPEDRLVAMGVKVAAQHFDALDRYRVNARLEGKIVYFRCQESRSDPDDRRSLWQRCASGGVQVIPVPGAHGSYHREPQFSAVVAGLRDVLAALDRKVG